MRQSGIAIFGLFSILFLASPSARAEYTPLPAGTVRIWDTNKTYTQKGPTPDALADKASWTLVPHGQTGYTPNGDLMLENDFYFLFCFTNKEDSIDLITKMVDKKGDNTNSNEIYKVHDTGIRNFGHGTMSVSITKYTTKEIIIQHAGEGMRTGSPLPITTTYRVLGGKPWLEVKPVQYVNQQGMHGKSRICAFLNSGSNERILDGKRETWTGERNIQAQADTIGIINFRRRFRTSNYDFMWFLTAMPGFETSSLTYMGFHADRFWEDDTHDRPSCGAQYVRMTDKVAIGTLGRKDVWEREDVLQLIAAGGTYTSTFKAPYPGKWRLIGFVVEEDNYVPRPRVPELPIPPEFSIPINGSYHYSTVDITNPGQKFTFTSPVAGTLDYLLIYLQDRNVNTPSDVFTPMDVYRQAIQGKIASCVGQHIFYNNSYFDGNNPGPNTNDDGAIAPDKTALLPGRTAKFANYTSYSKGINGVMVDIADLPGTPVVTTADFTFKVGSNPPAATTLLSANFDSGTDGFTYVDDPFWATSKPAYADGSRTASGGYSGSGGLRAVVGGVDNSEINGMSGGWSRSFNLSSESNVSLSLRYKLTQALSYESDEWSEALVSIDGRLVGTDGYRLVKIVGADDDTEPVTTGWQLVEIGLGTLAAGDHTLVIGCYNNKKTAVEEITEILIDDVQIKVSGGTPSDWTAAPTPTFVSTRSGAGVDGSDRVTIIWADNAIQKQWLQVTVKATTATCLAEPYVFYFGNAIGETGNSTTDARVTPTDQVNTRNNPHTLGGPEGPAGIDDAYDFNRDRKVGPTDEIISRNNGTSSSTALKLIVAP